MISDLSDLRSRQSQISPTSDLCDLRSRRSQISPISDPSDLSPRSRRSQISPSRLGATSEPTHADVHSPSDPADTVSSWPRAGARHGRAPAPLRPRPLPRGHPVRRLHLQGPPPPRPVLPRPVPRQLQLSAWTVLAATAARLQLPDQPLG